MNLRTANKRARRKRPMVRTFVACRGIWLTPQPGWGGYTHLADGRESPRFYRRYK